MSEKTEPSPKDLVDIHVNIGEVKTGRAGDLLKTTLGSCVGIAFLWKSKGVYALAHCLLPEASGPVLTIGAKYVSQAVPSVMALLKVRPENVGEIEVHVAGGANMLEQHLTRPSLTQVGALNVAAARKYLEANGFKVASIQSGGPIGRKMQVNCTTGEVAVSLIGS